MQRAIGALCRHRIGIGRRASTVSMPSRSQVAMMRTAIAAVGDQQAIQFHGRVGYAHQHGALGNGCASPAIC
jgi:hypothetical protein